MANAEAPQYFFISSEDRVGGSSRSNALFQLSPPWHDKTAFKPLKFQMAYTIGPRNDAVLHIREPATYDADGNVVGIPPPELVSSYGRAPLFVDFARPGGTAQDTRLAEVAFPFAVNPTEQKIAVPQVVQSDSTNWVWGGYAPPSLATSETTSFASRYMPLPSWVATSPPGPPWVGAVGYPPSTVGEQASPATAALAGAQSQFLPNGNGVKPFQYQMARIFEAAVNDVLWTNKLAFIEDYDGVTHLTSGTPTPVTGEASTRTGYPLNATRTPFVCVEPGGTAFCNAPSAFPTTIYGEIDNPGNAYSILQMGVDFKSTPANSAFINNTQAYAFGQALPSQVIMKYLPAGSVGGTDYPAGYYYVPAGADISFDANADVPGWEGCFAYKVSCKAFEFMVDAPDVAAIYGLESKKWYLVKAMPSTWQQRPKKCVPPEFTQQSPPLNLYFNMGYGSPNVLTYGPPSFNVHLSFLRSTEQSMTSNQKENTIAFMVPLSRAPGEEIEYISDTLDWSFTLPLERVDQFRVWFTDYWGQPLNDNSTDPFAQQKRLYTNLGVERAGLVPYVRPTSNQGVFPAQPTATVEEIRLYEVTGYDDSTTNVVSNSDPRSSSGVSYFASLPAWKIQMGLQADSSILPGSKLTKRMRH